ncbi:rpb7 (nucleomorph) [Hemiselmis andersenii]|uniref:Rpb7 n=1 Tax=Hemiselmis andersenii TaxID=464988 RepID=A9BK44_HEMAN|nr:rpb7 [Hemiselmis andersenii]ABW97877.1 rpb7 [Hemiselmis andersenii]|mmetsp:Transcript_21723/g.50401  ORF Transcript_21723/g.50401 Transcript_21723/m.50401 type:complete len:176 (+) Transcript_21723:907-1434(+)
MFFITTLNQNIYISAKYFKKNIKKNLVSTLLGNVEGSYAGPFGNIVIITEICNKWGKGKLIIGTPSAMFNVTFRAITFRPFKGEVFDSIITNLTNVGFFSEAGALQIFVSKNQLPNDFQYNGKDKVFFNTMSPEEKFCKDSLIRIKIISVKNEKNSNHVIGTIKGPFLGLLKKNS